MITVSIANSSTQGPFNLQAPRRLPPDQATMRLRLPMDRDRDSGRHGPSIISRVVAGLQTKRKKKRLAMALVVVWITRRMQNCSGDTSAIVPGSAHVRSSSSVPIYHFICLLRCHRCFSLPSCRLGRPHRTLWPRLLVPLSAKVPLLVEYR